jgi:hypothetical protein
VGAKAFTSPFFIAFAPLASQDYFRDMSHAHDVIAEAELAGVDLSLIDESLGYSYEQRAEHHQRR